MIRELHTCSFVQHRPVVTATFVRTEDVGSKVYKLGYDTRWGAFSHRLPGIGGRSDQLWPHLNLVGFGCSVHEETPGGVQRERPKQWGGEQHRWTGATEEIGLETKGFPPLLDVADAASSVGSRRVCPDR